MKTLHATFFAAALVLCAKPALAAGESTLDVSELTCEQFMNYDDTNKGLIMMWFEGYYTEEDEPTTIDFGKMASHLAKLLIACQADPSKKVLDLTDDAMGD
ncbi:MAG: HdeA/HdeB family chaperone [Methyloceanibacter sp.]|jgi:acid stress chaperone HdeB